MRVPAAFGYELMLQILQESEGTAVTVSELQMLESLKEIAQKEGILLSPEGAATYAALKKLVLGRWIYPEDKVLLINTGSAYKYMENL